MSDLDAVVGRFISASDNARNALVDTYTAEIERLRAMHRDMCIVAGKQSDEIARLRAALQEIAYGPYPDASPNKVWMWMQDRADRALERLGGGGDDRA